MNEGQVKQALLLRHFQREIKRQCDFAIKSFRGLEEAIVAYRGVLGRLPYETTHDEGVVEGSEEYYLKLAHDHKEEQEAEIDIGLHSSNVWFYIQCLLISLGNISKLLWPGKPVAKSSSSAVREKLRASLEISEDSPLKSRKLRNHFEHFDERLENWAASSTYRAFTDSLILVGDFTIVGPKNTFRHYDPENKILYFHGESYSLQPLLSAIKDLDEKAAIQSSQNPLQDVEGWESL